METSKSLFKARVLEYFRLVEETGDRILVTDRGKPKIDVRPFRGEVREAQDVLRGSVLRYDAPFDPVALDWEALA
jgi:hypothetical protein